MTGFCAARRRGPAWRRDVQAFGERGERRDARRHRDDLAVEEHVRRTASAEAGELGEGHRSRRVSVREVRRSRPSRDVGEHPHAVPLDLVRPVRRRPGTGRRGVASMGRMGASCPHRKPRLDDVIAAREADPCGDLEGRRLLRAGQRAGPALLGDREPRRAVPPGPPRRTAGASSTSGSAAIDGEQVPYDDIAKGYETEDGQMVVLTDEDLDEPAGEQQPRDRGREVRAGRPDRPDAAARSPTTSSRTRPRPSPTRCCATRSRGRPDGPGHRVASAPG